MTSNVKMLGYQTNKSGFAGINNSGFKRRVIAVNADLETPDTIYKDDSIPLTEEQREAIKPKEELKTVNVDVIELEIPKDIKGNKDSVPPLDTVIDDVPNRPVIDVNNNIDEVLDDIVKDTPLNKNVDSRWRFNNQL
jgi:hypothetical protein